MGANNGGYFGERIAINEDGTRVAALATVDDEVKIYQLINGDWVQLGNTIMADARGIVLNDVGDRIAISYFGPNHNGFGEVRVFEYTNEWVQIGNTLFSDTGNPDFFGNSIGINGLGNRVVVSATHLNETGQVLVYEFQGNEWVQLGGNINGVSVYTTGVYVAINTIGNRIIFDGMDSNDNRIIQVFNFQNGTWESLGQPVQHGSILNAYTSATLAINGIGNIFAVGDPNNDEFGTDSGLVKAYRLSNGIWEPLGSPIPGEFEGDAASQVAMNELGTVLAVASNGNDQAIFNGGQNRVFQFIDNDWQQIGNSIYGTEANEFFGKDLSISDDGRALAISSPSFNNFKGHVQVYALNEILDIEEASNPRPLISPNPFKSIIQIKGIEPNCHFELYNSLGQQVKTGTIDTTGVLNVESLKAGVYLLRVTDFKNSKVFTLVKE